MEVMKELSKIALVALLALLIVAGGLALLFGLGLGGLTVPLSPLGATAGVFAMVFLAGVVPAVLIAPPVYLYFWRRNRATLLSAVVSGALIGALIWLLDSAVLVYTTLGGILASVLTHLGAKRWLGPNCSFKPKPLRGSA